MNSFFSRSANAVVAGALLAAVVWAIVSLAPVAFARWF
jgi:hypothetical protein